MESICWEHCKGLYRNTLCTESKPHSGGCHIFYLLENALPTFGTGGSFWPSISGYFMCSTISVWICNECLTWYLILVALLYLVFRQVIKNKDFKCKIFLRIIPELGLSRVSQCTIPSKNVMSNSGEIYPSKYGLFIKDVHPNHSVIFSL